MAITIKKQDPFRSIWPFFTKWLGLLRGQNPEKAFSFIEGCSPKGYQFDVKGFRDYLRTFSGVPDESYEFSDILLKGDDFDDARDDSSVHQYPNGDYFAFLCMPLKTTKTLSHLLTVQFDFIAQSNGQYKTLLHIDDSTLID